MVRHENPSLLTDGAYILHHAGHFVAARYLDGTLEVNFGHRTHTWEAAHVCNQDATHCAWWREGAGWQLNLLRLAVFYISSCHATAATNGSDCAGASSPASTECPHFPSFLDSEFSDSHSAVSDRGLGPSRCFWIPLEEARRRISIFEGLLCDYKLLLVHQPSLFATIPSPFGDEEDRAWDIAVADRRASLSLLQNAVGDALASIPIADQRKAFKRMRMYVLLLRTFIDPIQQEPESLRALPNPCDSTISKRLWESAIYQQRKRWCRGAEDAVGGGQLEIHSALSGELLLAVAITPTEALVPFVRKAVAAASAVPYFAIDVLVDFEVLVGDGHSWHDCHCPDKVSVIKKPRSLAWTQDVFESIDSGGDEDLRQCLILGQDPDCVLQHSALTYAINQGNAMAVHILLQGGASLDLTRPGQWHAPLHSAAIGSSPAILQLLLDAKCNPNAPDLEGTYPVHHALREDNRSDKCRAELLSILLQFGADVMRRDADGDTAFSSAPTGRTLALCMDEGWERLTMLDIWQRHVELLVQYVWSPALFITCSPMHKQRCFFRDVLGGSTALCGPVAIDGSSLVSFHLACSGQEICGLHVLPDCPILYLKQHLAVGLGHLPFAVILLQAMNIISPLATTWADIGCPQEIGVLLAPRRCDSGQALSTAIQNQDHEKIIKILEAGQNPDCLGEVEGRRRVEPVLLTAAAAGFFYSVHLLLNGFADPNIAGNDRRTALHLAAMVRSPMTAQILLAHGADVKARDVHGETPLHFAALAEDVPVVKQLLLAGADALAPTTQGDIPLFWAYEADTRAVLMDGCWVRMSFLTLFLLNVSTLLQYTSQGVLKQLCRKMCRIIQQKTVRNVEDVAGGATADQAIACSSLHQYLFRGPVHPESFPRIWHQLELFHRYVKPLWPTLRKFPHLFWTLPVPFDVTKSVVEWNLKLLAFSTFIHLLQKGQFIQLEAVLITWFWPEIVQDLSLLEVVSSAKTSTSNRGKQLSSAMLFFHVLSLPHGKRSLPASRMSNCVFHRFVLLQRHLISNSKQPRSSSRDVSGGADMSQDFEAAIESEQDFLNEDRAAAHSGLQSSQVAEQANGVPAASAGVGLRNMEGQHDDAEVPRPEDDDLLQKCKKRRLLPGASDSIAKFQNAFADLRRAASEALAAAPVREPATTHSLLRQSAQVIERVQALQPDWPEQLVRLVAAACVLPTMRLSDAYLREHIFLLWLMEGNRFLRAHDGQCFLYNACGAFQVFRGSPPEQTVARVKEFILQLEGLFRSLPLRIPRNIDAIVQSVADMKDAAENFEGMLDSWVASAIFRGGAPKHREARNLGEDDEGGDVANPHMGWTHTVANAVGKRSVAIQRAVMDDKIYSLMIEWCDSPRVRQAGCAYRDLCIVYDDRDCNVRFVSPSPSNNIYTMVPHPLRPSLPDPVLAEEAWP